jgi:NADH dehydrogenase FAD-containing subunit
MDCDDPRKGALGELGHLVHDPEARRVLILGGGFGGIYAALRLEKLLARHGGLEVTLVTRDNYFLFTPMLPEVAAGELEQSTIVNPLRRLLRSTLCVPLATRRMRNEVHRSIKRKTAASVDRDRASIGAVESPLRSMVHGVQR